MTDRITITIPTDQVITANDRLHWAVKARMTRRIRTMAAWQARAEHLDHFENVLVTARIRYPDKRRRDIENFAPTLKAMFDGFTDAGIWPDDDDTHIIGPDKRHDPRKSRKGTFDFELIFTSQEVPF